MVAVWVSAVVERRGVGASERAGRGGGLAVNSLDRATNGLSCVRNEVKVSGSQQVLPTGGHGASNYAHAARTATVSVSVSCRHLGREVSVASEVVDMW